MMFIMIIILDLCKSVIDLRFEVNIIKTLMRKLWKNTYLLTKKSRMLVVPTNIMLKWFRVIPYKYYTVKLIFKRHSPGL